MDELKTIARDLIHTPAFYTALLALGHAVLFFFLPDFPREIVTAADGVIVVVAGAVTGQQVNAAARTRALQVKMFGKKL